MMIRSLLLAFSCASPALAEITVVTDIAPVHSLTAAVMEGHGAPILLIPGASDPHDVQLRPSDAARLSSADLVIWIGPELTLWLRDPLDTLARQTPRLGLLDASDDMALHQSEDGDHSHAHDHDDDHEALDPHAWLDPQIAMIWADKIAEALAEADPANAATYHANAHDLRQELQALDAETRGQLAPFKGQSYLTPHDGMAYFERRYDLPAAGHVTDSHARAPGPAHLSDLRARIEADGITCVLTPAGPNDGTSAILIEGHNTKTAPIDTTGATLPPGPALYPALIRNLSQALVDCLS